MNLFPKALPSRRMLAVLFIFVGAWLVRADQIQFSKPVVPLAAPAKEEKKLSQDRSRGLGFGDPTPDQPYVSQPQIIRVLPRESQEDDEEESDPRAPRDLVDPSDKHLRQDSARKAAAKERIARNQSRSAEPDSKRLDGSLSEDSQSLSPVRDFDLNEREPGQLSSNPLFGNRSSTNRSNGRNRDSLASREDSERQKDGFRPLALFGGPAARAKEKEKPTREVLEQRAAFEKLINPTAGIAAKTPGSFEPITALEPPRSALPVTMPVIGGGRIEPKRAEPVQQFGYQQARPASPVMGDMNKPSTKPAPAPGPSIDPFRQTPLNRQPITREFPARKF